MPSGERLGGRAKGTPNKSTALIRASIETYDPIGFMGKVMQGHMPNINENGKPDGTFETANQTSRMQAAQFLAKRIAPEVKENPISFDVGNIENIEDAMIAIGKTTTAVANGGITPSEGKTICDMLGTFVKIYEASEMSKRLDDLENRMIGSA